MDLDRLRLTLHSVFGDVVTVEMLFDGTAHEMPGIALPGERAVEAWMRLRRVVEILGAYPLILGTRADVERHADALRYRKDTPQQVIAASADVDPNPKAWFAELVMHERQWHADNGHDPDEARGFPEVGDWPEEPEESDGFSIPFDINTMDPHPEVLIALVPTELPWTVPAYLALGGWNDCPPAAKHCAMWKLWGETYGAWPVGASNDVVEFLVERPPETREAALELAWGQYGYCHDIVDQGTGTLAKLASALLDGQTWFFWWD